MKTPARNPTVICQVKRKQLDCTFAVFTLIAYLGIFKTFYHYRTIPGVVFSAGNNILTVIAKHFLSDLTAHHSTAAIVSI